MVVLVRMRWAVVWLAALAVMVMQRLLVWQLAVRILLLPPWKPWLVVAVIVTTLATAAQEAQVVLAAAAALTVPAAMAVTEAMAVTARSGVWVATAVQAMRQLCITNQKIQ